MKDKSIENAEQIVDFHPQITAKLKQLKDRFTTNTTNKSTNEFKKK
jgi:hypothetical protein